MDTLRDPGFDSNTREPQTDAPAHRISPIEFGRSPRYAEANGIKLIVGRPLPEPVLDALLALVDAVQRELGDAEERRLAAEADQPRAMCRWHLGQIAEFCGPCRSEEIGRRD